MASRCCYACYSNVVSVTDCPIIMRKIISSDTMSTIHIDLKMFFVMHLDFLNEQRAASYTAFKLHIQ